MDNDDHIPLTTVPDYARCDCGEQLSPGERAGFDTMTSTVVCLWCLADRKAGRKSPRRRGASVSSTVTPIKSMARTPRSRSRPSSHSSRRSRSPRTSVTLLVTLALVMGLAYADNVFLGHDSILRAFGISQLPGAPARGLDRQIPRGSDSTHFAYMQTKRPVGNDPVTWSSCDTIHVVVNKASAPPQADRILQESLDRVAQLSGLKFVIDGETSEEPIANRPAQSRNPLKGRWAPALVAWTTPETVPALKGDTAGIGGPREAPSSYPDERHFVSGIVYLDGPAISGVLRRSNGWAQSRAIVMHELGHMVGLAHVDSDSELMDGDNKSGITDFGAGDREGLRRLGAGACF